MTDGAMDSLECVQDRHRDELDALDEAFLKVWDLLFECEYWIYNDPDSNGRTRDFVLREYPLLCYFEKIKSKKVINRIVKFERCKH